MGRANTPQDDHEYAHPAAAAQTGGERAATPKSKAMPNTKGKPKSKDPSGALLYERYPSDGAIRQGEPRSVGALIPGSTARRRGRRRKWTTADPSVALERTEPARPLRTARNERAGHPGVPGGATASGGPASGGTVHGGSAHEAGVEQGGKEAARRAKVVMSVIWLVVTGAIALGSFGPSLLEDEESHEAGGSGSLEFPAPSGQVLASEPVDSPATVYLNASPDSLVVTAAPDANAVEIRSEATGCEPRLSRATADGATQVTATITCEAGVPFFVQVPAGTKVTASSRTGSVQLEGEFGQVSASSQSGAVTFAGTAVSDGATGVRLTSESGAVEFSGGASGEDDTTVSLNSTDGPVTADVSNSPWVMARSEQGAVELAVGEGVGRISARTSSGDIRMSGDLAGRRVNADSEGTVDLDLDLENEGSGDPQRSLRAASESGDIVLRP